MGYFTKGGHAQASVTTKIFKQGTNMANPSPVDSFFATFTGLKTILYRNISLLTVILFPLAYQMIIVDFLSEEHKSGACNNTGRQFQMPVLILHPFLYPHGRLFMVENPRVTDSP